MQIEWGKSIGFDDLEVNQTFRIKTAKSKNAVYSKVKKGKSHPEFFMYELTTGQLWPPTKSPVEIVSTKVTVCTDKPKIY
jgi:hypothetical protein